jgi:uncharacterized cupredoxin-like copper-binding protein
MHRRHALILLIAAVATGATACGSSSGGGSSSSTPAPTSSQPASGKTIDVTLKNFSITVAGSSHLQPGTYTFDVTNNGPSSHNLTVEGPGVEDQATPTFPSGQTKQLTVTLKNGSYELYCSVPGHKQAGMDTHITVGTGSGTAGSTSEGGGSSSSGGGWG